MRRAITALAGAGALAGCGGTSAPTAPEPPRPGRVTAADGTALARTLGSDGRRTAIGVTRPAQSEGAWTVAAGRRVRPMLAAVVRGGTARAARSRTLAIGAKTGSSPFADGTALSLVGIAPVDAPRVAVALTELGPDGARAGPALGPVLRRVLERGVALP